MCRTIHYDLSFTDKISSLSTNTIQSQNEDRDFLFAFHSNLVRF